MRILITGRDGQVAKSLAERGNADHDLIFVDRPKFDLADPSSIVRTVAGINPDIVFSVAAYTAVDKAESERDLAMAVNGAGPGFLARAAATIGSPVLHLSTDYVFDGLLDRPYVEDDQVCPLGVYGASKLAGERAIQNSGAHFAIIRTAWVYSPFGHNFVKTMLRLARDREILSVVDDQRGSPTSAFDIADAMLWVADSWNKVPGKGSNEIYHFTGTGEATWADFAREVLAFSDVRGGPTASVTGIPSYAYPTPAKRPANSRLDNARFSRTFGYCAPDWRASLERVVARLVP